MQRPVVGEPVMLGTDDAAVDVLSHAGYGYYPLLAVCCLTAGLLTGAILTAGQPQKRCSPADPPAASHAFQPTVRHLRIRA